MPVSTYAPTTHRDDFVPRHIGPSEEEIGEMLEALGYDSLDSLIDAAVPASLRQSSPLDIGEGVGEAGMLAELRQIAGRNRVLRSYIGLGYHGTHTPPVIQRNILENPGWYTAYTPYQSEVAQGRLEALLNFQTAVIDLTGLEIANASLLDEATAAAEAMAMSRGAAAGDRNTFLVSDGCHPQTIEVVRTRAAVLKIEVRVLPHGEMEIDEDVFGVLLQYPATDGALHDYRTICERAHEAGALVTAATDLLALTMLVPPGEWGADIAVGSSQRFGVPMGYGGPHAAFFATREEFRRQVPGRIIGVSRDADDRPALRMALQTREQHIRRERATSNICTAQVLLAVIAGMYAVWHGPDGLRRIAERVHAQTGRLAEGLERMGYRLGHRAFFDTLRVETGERHADTLLAIAREEGINLRRIDGTTLGISLDETVTERDLDDLLRVFARGEDTEIRASDISLDLAPRCGDLLRESAYLTHPVFHRHRSETEMLRYLKTLENRDLSLVHSMIALGSCTMKLNATAEMTPISWPEFAALHPFAPADQAQGYRELFTQLEGWLAEITGYAAVSLQPNAGSQGEYAGLLAIREYLASRGEGHRDICLIPKSAHGTNPASAVMAGMRVVGVNTDEDGNIDVDDLRAKAEKHADALAALMITYPSTHGVFEVTVREVCDVIHEHGGQVYLDGANLNAMVGLVRPAELGADVSHLNLHKTFCIPHGGGGPGMGPIGVRAHLAPFLPGHPLADTGGDEAIGPVSAAPWGSPSILPISWAYIRMMGSAGLTRATQVAILSANYLAARLADAYPVLYKGKNGRVAHECIIDTRAFRSTAGVSVEDIAKRLIDYGFHAPTVSFPVPGTMMIEPTESESKEEIDRFAEALIAIRGEIREIEVGEADQGNNLLSHAPHTAEVALSDGWDRPYARERAVYPAPWTREAKFWPAVGRVDNAWGDRNLMCACPPVEEFSEV